MKDKGKVKARGNNQAYFMKAGGNDSHCPPVTSLSVLGKLAIFGHVCDILMYVDILIYVHINYNS